ncbi:MAG TPA: hypothetical protein DEB24_07170 [Coriobacteriia bacterium]|nr:hypothetical protein [Coriobacteriia bacterium]
MLSFEYILVMLVAVLLSSLISHRFPFISTPLVQIALGIAIALIPFFHFDMSLDPALFLALFIAPLLYEDAKKADRATLWSLRRPIALLALGLVVVTCLAVGGFIHTLLDVIPFAAAIALAAALAPTDAVAVISLEESSTIDTKKRSILQGESLFNDASSIVCFQFALAAFLVGPFAGSADVGQLQFVGNVALTFLFMFIGGVVVGGVLMLLRYVVVRMLRSAGFEGIIFHVLFELLTPFIVFIAAEMLHVSGIIAVVVAGIAYSFTPRRQTPTTARHQIVSGSVWGVLTFSLNGLVFLILGTQLPTVISTVWNSPGIDNVLLVSSIVLILLALMLIRFVWVFVMNRNDLILVGETCAVDEVESSKRERNKALKQAERKTPGYWKAHLKDALVLTLTGVKGAISLALLLTIPLTLPSGEAFPQRELLLFIASGVIILSLLLANFLVPVVAPKIARPLQPESEVKAIIRIYRTVIRNLTRQDGQENKEATERVIRQYRERINAAGEHINIGVSAEDKLRCMTIGWERDHTLALIDANEVNASVGSVCVYQLSRMLALSEHHGETRWLIVNIFKQLVHQFKDARQHKKRFDDGSRTVQHRAMMALRDLQRDNCMYVIGRLEVLKGEVAVGEAEDCEECITVSVIEAAIEEYKRRMARLEDPERLSRLKLDKNQRINFEESMLRVEAHALQYERDAIEEALSEGNISRTTARHLRDNVAMMELDIEEQLD